MKPTIEGMIREGKDLNGALYVGVMLTDKGVKVIEYNLRFGDPETQIQLRLLKSDLLSVIWDVVHGKLDPKFVVSHKQAAVGIVVASEKIIRENRLRVGRLAVWICPFQKM